MFAKTWHFFEEQVSPYKSSFLQHVAGGGDKLDWLEKLKSTEKREKGTEKERERRVDCFTSLATIGRWDFKALKLRFRLSFFSSVSSTRRNFLSFSFLFLFFFFTKKNKNTPLRDYFPLRKRRNRFESNDCFVVWLPRKIFQKVKRSWKEIYLRINLRGAGEAESMNRFDCSSGRAWRNEISKWFRDKRVRRQELTLDLD